MLEVGDRFPVEKLPVKPEGAAVVYFYPKDLTPGCTMEAKRFNDLYDRFRDAGYEVIGVSLDSDESHDEFRDECGLRFPLVADRDGELTREVDVMKDYGEYGVMAARVTFLLDSDALVRQVWDVKDAGTHPDDVLATVTG